MIRSMRRLLYVLLAFLALGLAFSACDNGARPTVRRFATATRFR